MFVSQDHALSFIRDELHVCTRKQPVKAKEELRAAAGRNPTLGYMCEQLQRGLSPKVPCLKVRLREEYDLGDDPSVSHRWAVWWHSGHLRAYHEQRGRPK